MRERERERERERFERKYYGECEGTNNFLCTK